MDITESISRTDREVGERVRIQLFAASVPQAKAAEWLGVDRGAVSRRVNGVVPFSVGELSILADNLGLTLASFTAIK